MISLPSIYEARDDPRISDVALRVLVTLPDFLDVLVYRPLKHEVVMRAMKKERETIAYALRQLVQERYLLCALDDPLAPKEARVKRPKWYRLVVSRASPENAIAIRERRDGGQFIRKAPTAA